MDPRSSSEFIEYMRCVSSVDDSVKSLIGKMPSADSFFRDMFHRHFRFEFSLFLASIVDILYLRFPDLREDVIALCFRSITNMSFSKEYFPRCGVSVEDVILDRMERYTMVALGDWQPPAYWYLGRERLPDDALMQQLSLLGGYIYHFHVLEEIPIGDDIEILPLANSIFDPIKPIMPLLLYETVLSLVSKYATTTRDRLNQQPPKKKKLFGLFG